GARSITARMSAAVAAGASGRSHDAISPVPTSTAASGGRSIAAIAAASAASGAIGFGACAHPVSAAASIAAKRSARSTGRTDSASLEPPERPDGRAVQDLAAHVEARAVAVTVKAALSGIPAQPAPHMRAPCVEYPHLAARIPVRRGRLAGDVDDRALAAAQRARLARRRLLDLLRKPARRDGEVLAHERARPSA